MITIHAGHNPAGKIACGASDWMDESTAARELVKIICKKLDKKNIEYKNITINNGTSQTDVLKKLVKRANKINADINISIHFNSHKHSTRDGKTTGVECLIHPSHTSKKFNDDVAVLGINLCYGVSSVGLTNRGLKTRDNLYFLNKTKTPSIIIETCFVTDWDDVNIYKKNKKMIAEHIVNAISAYLYDINN